MLWDAALRRGEWLAEETVGLVQAKEAGEVEALIERARNTPKGQKKVYGNIYEMPKGYHPRFVEGGS